MSQLRIVADHILPARAGRATGLELTPELRQHALLAAGERPSVAAAMAVGLITKPIDLDARLAARRLGLIQ